MYSGQRSAEGMEAHARRKLGPSRDAHLPAKRKGKEETDALPSSKNRSRQNVPQRSSTFSLFRVLFPPHSLRSVCEDQQPTRALKAVRCAPISVKRDETKRKQKKVLSRMSFAVLPSYPPHLITIYPLSLSLPLSLSTLPNALRPPASSLRTVQTDRQTDGHTA